MQAIRTTSDVRELFAHLAHLPVERCGFAYLDRHWRVVGMRHGPVGTGADAIVPIRAVARDAIAFDAVRVVMAHNHPSGDPTPSRADLAITRRLGRALAALGAPLAEHLVITRGAFTSLHRLGLL